MSTADQAIKCVAWDLDGTVWSTVALEHDESWQPEPDRWVLKGGYGLILRLDPNRTSNDIDASYVAGAGEHALALEALAQAAAHDLGDFFAFEIMRVGAETEDRARRVSVLCRLGAREFTRFRVDIAVPRPDTTLPLGTPIFALAGAVRSAKLFGLPFRLFLLIDQYEFLYQHRQVIDFRPAF